MSKALDNELEDQVDIEDYDLHDDIEDGDYGFVISGDGVLKSLFTPDEFYLDPPENIRRILELLGIEDINTYWAGNDTIH